MLIWLTDRLIYDIINIKSLVIYLRRNIFMDALLNFKDKIRSFSANSKWEKLPLVHTTCVRFIKQIFQEKKLVPLHCNVLNKDLIYLFYGKPNYRNSHGTTPSTKVDWFPICLIFKNEILKHNKIAYIFPFDSGAFINKKYQNIIEEYHEIKDYELPDNLCDTGKFLNYMFASTKDYINGNPINQTITMPLELYDCYSLYSAMGDQPFDDRAKTVEISVYNEIEIKPENIALIICPLPLREFIDEVFPEFINVEYYNIKKLSAPSDFYGVIDELAFRYLTNNYEVQE